MKLRIAALSRVIMKRSYLLLALLWLVPAANAQEPIRVAVYDDAGVSKNLDALLQVLARHPDLRVKHVKAADIRAGVLSDIDVLLHPGGSGGGQGKALEDGGRDKVRDFVQKGGGYVGICAGAYLATRDYPWS